MRLSLGLCTGLLVTVAVLSCGDDAGKGASTADRGSTDDAATPVRWQLVFSGLPGALISTWGKSSKDVWAVGSDPADGGGAMILHFDGDGWTRLRSGLAGNLWWVHGIDGVVYAGGEPGLVVRLAADRVEEVVTPSSHGTVFGLWASESDDVWAVGGDTYGSSGAFIWHSFGSDFARFEASGLDLSSVALVYKVWGTSPANVWFVGTDGLLARYDGAVVRLVPPLASDPLFTVHTVSTRVAAVGGYDVGMLLEGGLDGEFRRATLPAGTRQLFGVWLTASEGGYAVGADARVLRRDRSGWRIAETGLDTTKAFHAVWVDEMDGVWAVGGDVLVPPLGAGVLIHRGTAIPDEYRDIDVALVRRPMDGGTPDARNADGSDGQAHADGAIPGADGAAFDAAVDATGDTGVDVPQPAGPGLALCGATICDLAVEQCCVDRTNAVAPTCVALGSPCPNNNYALVCDEGSDCTSGLVCCARKFVQFNAISDVLCTATCTTDRLCAAASSDCPTGAVCEPSARVVGYTTCQ